MLELSQLGVFIAAAEEMHFGRAAARLNMTQPTLSRQIQALEWALRVELFERANRTVKLTSAGRAFLPEAKRILFLTETAALADVVLPAANAYEKSGTMTNTCGDVQLVKKAGEISGTKSDFEMIVRIADAMGFEVRKLVPFGGGTRADMGQSRGAQSGEADRHAVWLDMQGLEPKLSPLDPMAIRDEIQRLVPGYGVSHANLLAGNSEHTSFHKTGLRESGTGAHNAESIAPANDNLFTSGTLGRYSRALKSVMESHEVKPAVVAAD